MEGERARAVRELLRLEERLWRGRVAARRWLLSLSRLVGCEEPRAAAGWCLPSRWRALAQPAPSLAHSALSWGGSARHYAPEPCCCPLCALAARKRAVLLPRPRRAKSSRSTRSREPLGAWDELARRPDALKALSGAAMACEQAPRLPHQLAFRFFALLHPRRLPVLSYESSHRGSRS